MVTRASMQQPAGAQPPLTDQQLRFAMSGGFWGSYLVDPQKKTMTFQTNGAFSPNMMGRELTRSFELAGDRLTITYGGGQHYAPAGTKWTTDAEARGAFSGYVGYFGALSVYPNMVFHQILAGISFTGGTTLKRPLELSASGDDVTIKFPPATNQQGQQTTTMVTLHRLSGEKEMMPSGGGAR